MTFLEWTQECLSYHESLFWDCAEQLRESFMSGIRYMCGECAKITIHFYLAEFLVIFSLRFFVENILSAKESLLMKKNDFLLLFMMTSVPFSLPAQSPANDTSPSDWSFHFQQTIITQYHPDFSAKYSGQNSLDTSEPAQTSITSTFFIGRRLWNGT